MDKEKMENWVSINLPEGCPNICISFDREAAKKQIEGFGAKPRSEEHTSELQSQR